MRTAALVALGALVGGLIGGLMIYFFVQDTLQPGVRSTGGSRSQADAVSPTRLSDGAAGPSASQTAQTSEWGPLIASANSLVAARKPQEAQELYLAVLLIEPTHQAAMRGLVRVVRLMSGGDPAVLRRQAEEYRGAIARGLETDEHYTAPAMELLARASLQAAAELQRSGRRGGRQAPAGATDARRSQSQPKDPRAVATPPPKAKPPAKPATSAAKNPPKVSTPEISRPAAPSPIPPVNVNEPFFVVAVGPIASGERASAITAELTIAGFAARVRQQEAGGYVITLGPYRESEARRAAAYVRSRFGQALPVTLTPAQ